MDGERIFLKTHFTRGTTRRAALLERDLRAVGAILVLVTYLITVNHEVESRVGKSTQAI